MIHIPARCYRSGRPRSNIYFTCLQWNLIINFYSKETRSVLCIVIQVYLVTEYIDPNVYLKWEFVIILYWRHHYSWVVTNSYSNYNNDWLPPRRVVPSITKLTFWDLQEFVATFDAKQNFYIFENVLRPTHFYIISTRWV